MTVDQLADQFRAHWAEREALFREPYPRTSAWLKKARAVENKGLALERKIVKLLGVAKGEKLVNNLRLGTKLNPQRPLFPKKRKPSKGGPGQPHSQRAESRELQRRRREAERARAESHGLYGDALPEEELAELAEGTLEDELAEDRIREALTEDVRILSGKKRTPEEEARLLEARKLLENDEEIARLARVRCEFCGADPRSPEYTGLDVLGARGLEYPGCCPAGQEALADWIHDAPAEERLRWTRALFGPYVGHHGEIAYVTGPMGHVEQRRRGEWVETEQRADPYQVSYALDVQVVRDSASRELVGRVVGEHHEHMAWAAGTAWKFGILVHNGPDLVGVAWIQNPGARSFPQDGTWLDVARVAIRRDLPPYLRGNAASLIYSTAWRAARDGTWVSDDEWFGPLDPSTGERRFREGIKFQSDLKRERAEAAAAAALAHSGTPGQALVTAWGQALALDKPLTWEKVRRTAQFVAAYPWRIQRKAVRMITYTLADEEVGTTLKAAGWEPAAWSAPHAAPSGARKGREGRAGSAAKIRWQVGLPEHARPIVALERQLAKIDRVAVGPSRGGLRPAGGGVETLALRVYGIVPGPDGVIRHQNAVTWEETADEEASRPKGARRLLNPPNPLRHRRPDPLDPNTPEEHEPNNLRASITPYGAKPKAVDYHVVQGKQPVTLILDVANVRHYGPELFFESRCPLLAGYREGKQQVLRPGVSFSGAPVYATSFDLENLARRVGLPLAKVERLLVLEGRAWCKAKGRRRAKGAL